MNTAAQNPHAESLKRAAELLQQGQTQQAMEQLREVLRERPDDIAALHLLGIAQRRGGLLDQALQVQQSILKKEPGFAAAWQEIGLCHSTAGRTDEAMDALRRATELDPRMVNSWKYLGDLALGQGDADTALDAYGHIPVKPGRDPLLARARELLDANGLALADTLLRAVLDRRGRDAGALRMLAEVASRLGATTDAMQLLESALEAAPDDRQARFDYANLLSRRQRYPEALQQADRLVAESPGEQRFRLFQAALLDRSGQYEKAKGILRGLLDQDSGLAHVWTGLSMLQRTLGERAEAIASLHKSIDAQPDRGEAWYLLADLKVHDFSDAQVDAMRRSVDRAPRGSDDEVWFSFALGRALEARERWDEAFEFYRRGNEARGRRANWDPARHESLVAGLERHADTRLFERLAGAGCPDAAPIFVVGLPRSGSTLVEQVLTAHSQVDGTMELPIMATLVKELNYRQQKNRRRAYPAALTDLDAEACRQIGEAYLERAQILRGDAPHFVDKMPNNFEHVALIRLVLPNARVIDVRRDPVANGFSAWRQLFQTGQEWSFDLEHIGRYTNAYVDLMGHWDRVLPGFVHRVRYEDLVESPHEEIGRLLDFVGLEPEDPCFAPERNPRPVRTASSEQVRQPLYRDALEHWKHFEEHLGPLLEALGRS